MEFTDNHLYFTDNHLPSFIITDNITFAHVSIKMKHFDKKQKTDY